jgi:ATP-dependent RNA helicase DHX57
VLVQDAAGHQVKLYARDVGRVFLHPSSVNYKVGRYESTWCVYSERVQTGKVFVREVTMVPTYSLLLFGGCIDILHEQKQITVDGWVRFEAPAKIAVLFRQLRAQARRLTAAPSRHAQRPSRHPAQTVRDFGRWSRRWTSY